jgi:hypothetical protein
MFCKWISPHFINSWLLKDTTKISGEYKLGLQRLESLEQSESRFAGEYWINRGENHDENVIFHEILYHRP